ncbi:FtsX-like permease family protein [Virgibacillus pantothenticus]|uniref:FtsX-like permease family protein n=4 Tax=Bacillaceae TaxID=186817 RepID=UPI0020B2B3A0|nr:FtsX-like permease family protein [Virgibacillus pantothenticus]MEB5454754.1 FtsX-like permease family protein [Virgibacillus pantothenticus]MEB5468571.1 FtsX-like permease family protein [Virgibacillus pantothenticus]
MRKMFKDYLVLLFGLTISIAIFYMFQTLAQNEAFVEANSLINSIMFIFHVGTVILGFITIFYTFYATSFIQTLRQKEMAMYMTLGAKKSKITQLMFMETLFIGLISLAIGIILGFGLTTVMTDLLMEKLNLSAEAEGFKAIYTKSILSTVIFYVALFLLTSIVNAWQIGRKKVLDLLQANQKQDVIKTNGVKTFLGVVFSVILIAIAYYIFINMLDFKSTEIKKIAVIIITVTVIPGTFFMFIYLLPFFVKKLKKNRILNETGINSFTLGQLRFRMLDLTKVLGTVAMLIALGLGAMTAGISFYHNAEVQTSKLKVNDIAIYQPIKEDMDTIKTMKLPEKHTYVYKLTDDNVYFLKSNLLKQPPLIPDTAGIQKLADVKIKRVASKLPAAVYSMDGQEGEMLPEAWVNAISGELNASFEMFGPRMIYVVDENHFQKINAEEEQVILARTDDFTKYLPKLKQLEERQKEVAELYTEEPIAYYGGKSTLYTSLYQLSSGTIFMGVFLGIAFLMMMASVLMFKLLSSARADIERYHMLRKIGVRKKLLERSIYRELFLLFLFPAIVGFAHVLVGMQAFAIILVEPYTKIWLPISIFLLIYGIYYVITVQLYKRIVLPKQK